MAWNISCTHPQLAYTSSTTCRSIQLYQDLRHTRLNCVTLLEQEISFLVPRVLPFLTPTFLFPTTDRQRQQQNHHLKNTEEYTFLPLARRTRKPYSHCWLFSLALQQRLGLNAIFVTIFMDTTRRRLLSQRGPNLNASLNKFTLPNDHSPSPTCWPLLLGDRLTHRIISFCTVLCGSVGRSKSMISEGRTSSNCLRTFRINYENSPSSLQPTTMFTYNASAFPQLWYFFCRFADSNNSESIANL